jgi:hypothetical protein
MHLSEKSLSLDLEIQQLNIEKDASTKIIRELQNKVQSLTLQIDDLKQLRAQPIEGVQKGYVQSQINKIQTALA